MFPGNKMLWFSWFHVILCMYLNYFIIVILYSSAFWAQICRYKIVLQIFCPCSRTAIKCGKDYYGERWSVGFSSKFVVWIYRVMIMIIVVAWTLKLIGYFYIYVNEQFLNSCKFNISPKIHLKILKFNNLLIFNEKS